MVGQVTILIVEDDETLAGTVARNLRARAYAVVCAGTLAEAASEIHRTFGLLGEPRVNVLALNLALDRLHHGR